MISPTLITWQVGLRDAPRVPGYGPSSSLATVGFPAQNILLEGFIRPANWSFNRDHSKGDVPTFGGYYLGLELGREYKIPDWAARDLMDRSQKRGKGQKKVLIGALYRGADNHVSYKGGGNEMVQLQVAHCGIVTTSEKYTIAHSHHVGLQFFALKWPNLPTDDGDDDETSDDVTYRGKRPRSPAPTEAPPDTAENSAPVKS